MLQFLFVGLQKTFYGSLVHFVVVCHHLLCQHIAALKLQRHYLQRLLDSRQGYTIIQYVLPVNLCETGICHLFHSEETLKSEALFADQHHIDHINADTVMTALGANDYRDMLTKMKEKFPSRSAFADIKAWLTASGISFDETESE